MIYSKHRVTHKGYDWEDDLKIFKCNNPKLKFSVLSEMHDLAMKVFGTGNHKYKDSINSVQSSLQSHPYVGNPINEK